MAMVKNMSYSLWRVSDRLKSKKKIKPVALAAEEFVCRGLGIVKDGEQVSELAMKELSRRFDGEIPDDVLAAMRQLFQVDALEDEAVDVALLSHGGAAGLELGDEALDTVVGQA
jgi:hypothetical protein